LNREFLSWKLLVNKSNHKVKDLAQHSVIHNQI
jgi:hypothetical protein